MTVPTRDIINATVERAAKRGTKIRGFKGEKGDFSARTISPSARSSATAATAAAPAVGEKGTG